MAISFCYNILMIHQYINDCLFLASPPVKIYCRCKKFCSLLFLIALLLKPKIKITIKIKRNMKIYCLCTKFCSLLYLIARLLEPKIKLGFSNNNLLFTLDMMHSCTHCGYQMWSFWNFTNQWQGESFSTMCNG